MGGAGQHAGSTESGATPAAPRPRRAGAGLRPLGRARLSAGIGGGTSMPGVIARRLDPAVLRKVLGSTHARKIVICGSNGKTTTARMVAALARSAGCRVTQNRSGSNLLAGVTAVAVNGADLLGRLDADLLIFEIDEATIRHAVPEIEPDAVIVTNIFRDQLDRYGELYAVARALETMIRQLPQEATVILNGDDPLLASFAPEAVARRLYFGMQTDDVGTQVPEHAADTVRCVHCQHDLDYAKVYISHLGAFRCPNCGYARPPLDVAVAHAQLAALGASQVTLSTPAGSRAFELALPGLHNVYNAAAAVAGALALGLDLSGAEQAFSSLRPAFGRLEPITAGDRQIVLAFVKNPTSYNTTLRTLLQEPGQKHILSAHSHAETDGQDFAWLWDVDFEELAPQVASLVASGNKAEELAMRFKYAGVPEDRVTVIHDRPGALDYALRQAGPGGTLYALAGYTPLMELRRVMDSRGWVPPFWQQ